MGSSVVDRNLVVVRSQAVRNLRVLAVRHNLQGAGLHHCHNLQVVVRHNRRVLVRSLRLLAVAVPRSCENEKATFETRNQRPPSKPGGHDELLLFFQRFWRRQISVRKFGASCAAFSKNDCFSSSLIFGAGAVRLATGVPTTSQNSSCIAGVHMQSMRDDLPAMWVKK